MRFENLLILNSLIFVIPILIWLYIRIFKKYNSIINKIGERELILKLIKNININRKKLKIKLIFLAVIFIFLALSRLQLGLKTVEAKRKGIDVIISLDTSLSMLAEDVKPNRLEKAKQEIEKLINVLQGDRIGLIGFSGTAFMLCPLTLDKSTAKLFLSILDNEIMPVQGTGIAKAINLAQKSFSQKEKKYKVLILITDGEDHQGEVIRSAEDAAKDGIQIFSIGIGEPKGEPIPIKDKTGKKIGYKKDNNGNLIVSRLDEDTLKKCASITNGQYYHASSNDWGLSNIYERINSLEKKELKTKLITIFEEKYQFFLFFAILLLFLEFFISEKRNKVAFIFFLLIYFSFDSLYALSAEKEYKKENYDKALEIYSKKLKKNSKNQKIKYNLGNVYFKKKNFKESEKYYSSIETEDKEVLFRKYYNLGNTAYKDNKFKEAIGYYKKALDINSEDLDSKFNIEYINTLLKKDDNKKDEKQKEQEKQEKQDKKNDQEKNEQDKQKQQEKKQDSNKLDNKNKGQNQKENKEENKNTNTNSHQDENKENNQNQNKKQEQEKNQGQAQKQEKKQDTNNKKDQNQSTEENASASMSDKQDENEEFSLNEVEMLLNQIDEDKSVLKEINKREVKGSKEKIIKDW